MVKIKLDTQESLKVKETYPFQTNINSVDKAAQAMETVLDSLLPGWFNDPSTRDTPLRFIKYLAEYRQPIDLESIFGSVFESRDTPHSMVIQANIPFKMICEHHLLPALGKAAIGYVPNKKILGLSKITRLMQAVGTERPSLQEHVMERVQDLMESQLEPKGSMVVIKATHGCMACRGVNEPGVVTTTSSIRGVFRDNPNARKEMLSLIQTEMSMGGM